MRKLLITSAMCLAMTSFAQAQTQAQKTINLSVGKGKQFAHLADAVAAANMDTNADNYYVITLAPQTYVNDFAEIDRPMTIQAAQASHRATLQATIPLPNEKGILLTFAPLTVRNLVFSGARISDDLGGNGAGIRDQQGDVGLTFPTASLTIINSVFHDNQEAVLQGDDAAEVITISNSQFKNNGNSNPAVFQHGAYINTAASLIVTNSIFCGQLIGHLLKSRAAQTTVTGSQFYGGEGAPAALGCRVGDSSYDIDTPNGGVVTIDTNTLVQGPSVQNNTMIDYGAEGIAFSDNSLTVSRNSFISTAGSIGIYDPACIPVQLDNNTYQGLSEVINPSQCVAAP